jgi:hypothetical protein
MRIARAGSCCGRGDTQDRDAQCVKRWHLPTGVVTTVAGSMSGLGQNDAAAPVYTRGVAGAIEIMEASAHPVSTSTFDAEVPSPNPTLP